MTHKNRGRVTVEKDGDWKIFTSTLPANAVPLGVIRGRDLAGVGAGALVRLENGSYALVNDGVALVLDGRKVSGALGLNSKGGRKEEMDGGRNVTFYLSSDAIARAKEIGGGNVSKGIREALKNF